MAIYILSPLDRMVLAMEISVGHYKYRRVISVIHHKVRSSLKIVEGTFAWIHAHTWAASLMVSSEFKPKNLKILKVCPLNSMRWHEVSKRYTSHRKIRPRPARILVLLNCAFIGFWSILAETSM